MIVILKHEARQEQIDRLKQFLLGMGLRIDESKGENSTILGLVGDTTRVDADLISSLDAVEAVRRVQEPYKKANRKFHPQDTMVDCGGVTIGHGLFQIIAGPCSVESEEQMVTVAKAVKAAGATLLRGGAFKPRTSPYAFQGLHEDGLKLLLKAKEATGLPVVTEIMDASHLPLFDDVDVIQVGARNMQNFELLKVLGKTHKPILLKRGLADKADRHEAWSDRVYRAYWVDGRDIGQIDVLCALAADIGLNADEMRQALENRTYADDVKTAIQNTLDTYHPRGVPILFVNGQRIRLRAYTLPEMTDVLRGVIPAEENQEETGCSADGCRLNW